MMGKNKSPVSREGKNKRTNIRMSKLARAIQSSTAETNWSEMVKMLYEADASGGRKAENRRMISLRSMLPVSNKQASYSNEQIQYILFLMLIISTAEKRIQEVYRTEFAHRCDSIDKRHGLKEDEYWPEGNEPGEWQELNAEFEQRATQLHLETLREYHQNDIAELVQANGIDQLFEIMTTVRSQFIRMLKDFQGSTDQNLGSDGTLPEMLQSAAGSSRR